MDMNTFVASDAESDVSSPSPTEDKKVMLLLLLRLVVLGASVVLDLAMGGPTR